MTHTLRVCFYVRQMESQAFVNSSVVLSSVRKERPLWTRSVFQVILVVTMRDAVVEENVLADRSVCPRLIAWMVHHATQVICVCMVGADGFTPFRRLKVRRFGTPLAGFQ